MSTTKPRRITNYYTVRKTDPSEFSNAVTKMLDQGWELFGPLIHSTSGHHEIFVQAMVQYLQEVEL